MQNLILRGRVFDGISLHSDAVVRVNCESGVISGFGERGSVDERESETLKEIDLRGRDYTIMPGMIDAHVHFFGAKGHSITDWATTPDVLAALRTVKDLRNLLRSGFTSVRELGTKGGTYLSKAAAESAFESPTIVSCGRALSQTGGDDDPTELPLNIAKELASYSYFCDGPDECRKATRQVIRDGASVVKIYTSGGFSQGGRIRLQFTLEEIRAIVDEAHRSGLKVAAHAYGEEALMNAIKGDCDSIEHGLGLTEDVAKEIKSREIYYVPTLVVYQNSPPSTNMAREEMVKRHLKEDMELVRDMGIKVVTGSDILGDASSPHGSNFEEIANEAKFIGNTEALVAATSRAAECLDLPQTGSIKQGLQADIVVVKGEPLSNIQKLAPANISLVMKSGQIHLNNLP